MAFQFTDPSSEVFIGNPSKSTSVRPCSSPASPRMLTLLWILLMPSERVVFTPEIIVRMSSALCAGLFRNNSGVTILMFPGVCDTGRSFPEPVTTTSCKTNAVSTTVFSARSETPADKQIKKKIHTR